MQFSVILCVIDSYKLTLSKRKCCPWSMLYSFCLLPICCWNLWHKEVLVYIYFWIISYKNYLYKYDKACFVSRIKHKINILYGSKDSHNYPLLFRYLPRYIRLLFVQKQVWNKTRGNPHHTVYKTLCKKQVVEDKQGH